EDGKMVIGPEIDNPWIRLPDGDRSQMGHPTLAAMKDRGDGKPTARARISGEILASKSNNASGRFGVGYGRTTDQLAAAQTLMKNKGLDFLTDGPQLGTPPPPKPAVPSR